MNTMYWWNAEERKAAPVGVYSSIALAFVAASSSLLRLLLDHPHGFAGRLLVASLIVVAYLAFSPALACSLYSLVFERPKRFAIVGLTLAALSGIAVPVLLDSVLFLPFAFLGVMGVMKFVKWRTERRQTHLRLAGD
jgi:hypothetical protein